MLREVQSSVYGIEVDKERKSMQIGTLSLAFLNSIPFYSLAVAVVGSLCHVI
jgi:hypothetical protein